MTGKKLLTGMVLLTVLLAGCLTGNGATGGDPAVRLAQQTADSVFEIVALKPYDSPDTVARKKEEGREKELFPDLMSYEKELDWKNLDYNSRNDEYVPLGTAFAISGTELATAAHVLNIRQPTWFGRLFIRNARGEVFEIDRITRYSYRRDYTCFTVKGSPELVPLKMSRSHTLNEKVYSVGNALGKGIIYREGLLTSTEKEPENGAWSFLLFSAPASPGNSGGPLLNASGEVVGIVLSKTENENLNYALPVTEWIDDPGTTADLGWRISYVFINTTRKYGPVDMDKKIPLPAPYDEFRKISSDWVIEYSRDMISGFHKQHGPEFFPRGERAAEILQHVGGFKLISIVGERDDHSWGIFNPSDVKAVKIGRTGNLISGKFGKLMGGSIIAPDEQDLSEFLDKPEAFASLFLEGYPLYRYIGSEPFRISSLGPVMERRIHTDTWGRKWIRMVWAVPFADSVLILYCLPSPEGCAFLGYLGDAGDGLTDISLDMEFYTDYSLYSYNGSYKRWKEFLGLKKYLPRFLSGIRMDADEKGRFLLDTALFTLDMPGDLAGASDESRISLDPFVIRCGEDFRMETVGFGYRETDNMGTAFLIQRIPTPPEYLPKNIIDDWKKVVRGSSPFNRERIPSDGYTAMIDLDPVMKGKTPEQRMKSLVIYLVSLGEEGDIPHDQLESTLSIFEKTLTVKEPRE